ncbi:MAG: trigger factor [Oscillospiraceae bacterium]|jgi:trigger factor|nr:trigger factor [Oscillospiraceae bacterium]
MTVKSVAKEKKSLTVLTIEIGAEEFSAAVEQAFRKNIGKMNIPGFRKGKAPRKMVEKLYGEGVFYQDAVNATWPDAYDKAVEQEGIEPVERPDVEVETIGAEGYTFTAKVHVYPEIQIGQYRGLSAYYPPADVSESDIDTEVSIVRERNASLVTVDRPAALGDTLILDYEGFVGGESFDGGKGERQMLELGSHRFIPGFEEALVGVSAGGEPEVQLTFPEDYHAEELAGKPAVFRCKIHEVKEKQLPEADDEFAKDISSFDTLAAYRDDVRETLLREKTKESERVFENGLISQILKTFEGDVPDAMVARQVEDLINDFGIRLRRQGLDIEGYMRYSGIDQQALIGQFYPQAETNTKVSLIFDKIAKLEGLTLDEGELDAEYDRLAELHKADNVRELIPGKALTNDLLALKASKLIMETAVRLDTPPEPESDAQTEQVEEPAAEPVKKPRKTAKKSAKAAEETEGVQ